MTGVEYVRSYTHIVLAICLAIHIAITIGIFRMASNNGMSGILWATLYFFTMPVGLALFLIASWMNTLAVSDMRPSKPGRIKASSPMERDPGYMGYRDKRFALPLPSKSFHDSHLAELIDSFKWDEAVNHAKEMIDLSVQDSDRLKEDDYRKALLWVEMKRSPFMGD